MLNKLYPVSRKIMIPNHFARIRHVTPFITGYHLLPDIIKFFREKEKRQINYQIIKLLNKNFHFCVTHTNS
jgi:hypothetical protein